MELDINKINYRRLDENDVIKSFDCGDEDLNNFITHDAPMYYRARLSTSYAVEEKGIDGIIGYFSLAHDRISLTDFPSNSAYNRFRKSYFARGKMFKSYPAIKICRLATASKYHKEGIGSMIVNMIIASYQQDTKAGCRFVTVDAYNSALPFYYEQGFLPLSKEDEGADTRLLYFDLQQV